MFKKRIRGHSISVNTTGKPQFYSSLNEEIPKWKKSSSVIAFNEAIKTKENIHYKIFIIIFSITAISIIFFIPWFYDLPTISGDAARTTGSSVVQGVHQLSVMITTFIALAIPLTANFYTPRLVDIFLKDSTNITYLVIFAILSSVSVFMNSFIWSNDTAPMIPYCLMVSSAVLGWIVIIPYYYYIMKFLNPEVIVNRVATMLIYEIKDAVNKKKKPSESRKNLNSYILQIGDIGFRSMDRKDAKTTISCIQALCYTLDIFREQKVKINQKFFQVEVAEFPMLSQSGLNWLSHASLWVEEQILRQIQKCFSSALSRKMPGIVSFISLALREQCIPLMNDNPRDRANLELFIRFLNTFLREAINQGNMRALFNMFYQYTSLIKDLSKWCPDLLLPTVRYITNYGKLCGSKHLDIAVQTYIYDIGNLGGFIYRVNSPHADCVLEIILAQEYNEHLSIAEKTAIVHSRLILASFLMYLSVLLNRELKWAIDKITASLLHVPPDNIIIATKNIVETTEEMFWEITDRIVNFNYIPPQQRPHLEILKDRILKLQEQTEDSKIIVGSIDYNW